MSGPLASISAGEIGGLFAGGVALLATVGGGIRWLLGWKARQESSFHAKLLSWEAKLAAREVRLDEEQAAHFARIEARLMRAETVLEAVLGAYHLIAGELRTVDPANLKLGMADELLKAAFKIEPVVPADMAAALDRIREAGR